MSISAFASVSGASTRPMPILTRQPPRLEVLNRLASREERLPFTVRVARGEEALLKAVAVRHAAYARHLPELAARLSEPEDIDREPGVVVLLAESKLDGSPLGSARIQSNRFRPLCVEQSVQLPAHLAHGRLAEVTRLGIVGGSVGRLVRIVLIKACFQYCEQQGIEWAIAAGRAPIDRQYEQLLFEDLYPEQGFIPLQHAGNLPHRVMGFEIATGPSRWMAAQHPLLDFFCHTRHPDVDLGEAETPPLLQGARERDPQPSWTGVMGGMGAGLRGMDLSGGPGVALA